MGWLKRKLLRWALDDVHQQLVLHAQHARLNADYLRGGANYDLVVSAFVLSPEEAGAAIREELDVMLDLLGAEA